MSKSKEEKLLPNSIKKSQQDILREFLLDEYTEFELTDSPLLKLGLPNKETYKKIIALFKKGINKNEIAKFCVDLDGLYSEYVEYCSNHLYTIPLLTRQQFSRKLSRMTLLDDMRELVLFRYSRKQIKFVFPLLKKNKI